MAGPPNGTVTFLFTDIEGSTKMWKGSPEAMRIALARHDEILREAMETRGGYVFKTVGDAFCAYELLVENYVKNLANSNRATPLSESRARNLSSPVFVVWQQYGHQAFG